MTKVSPARSSSLSSSHFCSVCLVGGNSRRQEFPARTRSAAFRTLKIGLHRDCDTFYTPNNTSCDRQISSRLFKKNSATMENERGELVDLYVLPASPPTTAHLSLFPSRPRLELLVLTTHSQQLRPPQVQRNESHHPSQGPRVGADLGRQGGRERALHGREPGLRAVWICARDGRER